MRTRVWATSAVLGAAMLIGGGAAAAAAPAPSDVTAKGWTKVGKYRSYSACMADGSNSVHKYKCEPSGNGTWTLYVWH